ncbi:MAG: winged helix-turn-helix transcriptional regulator [Thermoplasmata archaeon]
MDDTDLKIIGILKKNSRTSNVEIASVLGITEGAIRRRIENLKKGGIIQRFTIETARTGIEGFVLVKSMARKTKDITKKMGRFSDRIYELSGEYDIAAMIWAPTVEELNSKVDKIRKFDGLLETNTLIRLVED